MTQGPKQFEREYIWVIFQKIQGCFGLFRFVTKQFYLFRLFRFRFETPKQTENVLFLVSRNKPKQTRNRSCFGLFRFEPKLIFVCFEDTLSAGRCAAVGSGGSSGACAVTFRKQKTRIICRPLRCSGQWRLQWRLRSNIQKTKDKDHLQATTPQGTRIICRNKRRSGWCRLQLGLCSRYHQITRDKDHLQPEVDVGRFTSACAIHSLQHDDIDGYRIAVPSGYRIRLDKSLFLPDELVQDGEEAGPAVRRERDLLVHLEVVQVEGWTRVLPDNIWFGLVRESQVKDELVRR